MTTVVKFNNLFKVRQYPAGESHLVLRDGAGLLLPGTTLTLIADLEFFINSSYGPVLMRNFDGLAMIAQADEILKSMDCDPTFVIPYMPYGRHDRREHAHDALPVGLARKILDGVKVVTIDPHSDVTANEWAYIGQEEFVRAVKGRLDPAFSYTPVIPDMGASKKAYDWMDCFDNAPVQALKRRDPATGSLSGFALDKEYDFTGRRMIVIDDICDGGGTFMGVANLLYAAGADSVSLAVTHGLFTKGLADLFELYHQIYTLDRPGLNSIAGSMEALTSGRLKVIDTRSLVQNATY